jgi:hypothetical protein
VENPETLKVEITTVEDQGKITLKATQIPGVQVRPSAKKVGDPEVGVQRTGGKVTFSRKDQKDTVIAIPLAHRAEGTDEFVPYPDSIFDQGTTFVLKAANGYTKEVTVKADAPIGCYTYCIYCVRGDSFAEMDSTPRVIIEPP